MIDVMVSQPDWFLRLPLPLIWNLSPCKKKLMRLVKERRVKEVPKSSEPRSREGTDQASELERNSEGGDTAVEDSAVFSVLNVSSQPLEGLGCGCWVDDQLGSHWKG